MNNVLRKLTLIFSLIMFGINNGEASSNKAKQETAILAGGCFWGMEELFGKVDGVVETNVGFTGGSIPNPSYTVVTTGLTGHAEAIEIVFDSQKISYEKLLKFFFTIHDPTTLNRQQNDSGTQYRSAIFYLNDAQKRTAESVIAQAEKSGVFKKKITTEVTKAGKFYLAETYHQNYLEKNPYGYTCHHVRNEWKF